MRGTLADMKGVDSMVIVSFLGELGGNYNDRIVVYCSMRLTWSAPKKACSKTKAASRVAIFVAVPCQFRGNCNVSVFRALLVALQPYSVFQV